jgi:hypothetical protein
MGDDRIQVRHADRQADRQASGDGGCVRYMVRDACARVSCTHDCGGYMGLGRLRESGRWRVYLACGRDAFGVIGGSSRSQDVPWRQCAQQQARPFEAENCWMMMMMLLLLLLLRMALTRT